MTKEEVIDMQKVVFFDVFIAVGVIFAVLFVVSVPLLTYLQKKDPNHENEKLDTLGSIVTILSFVLLFSTLPIGGYVFGQGYDKWVDEALFPYLETSEPSITEITSIEEDSEEDGGFIIKYKEGEVIKTLNNPITVKYDIAEEEQIYFETYTVQEDLSMLASKGDEFSVVHLPKKSENR